MPFEFQAPPDTYGKTIAQLIAERGQQLAQGQAGAGQAWASGAQQIGQIPAQVQQQQAQGQEVKLRQIQIDQATKATAYQKTAIGIAQTVTDPASAEQAMMRAGIPPTIQDPILKSLTSMETSHKEAQADAGHIAYQVLKSLPADASMDDKAHAVSAALGVSMGVGVVSQDDAQSVIKAMAGGADPLALAVGFMGRSPSKRFAEELKPTVLAGAARPGGQPATLVGPTGTLATGAAAPPAPPPNPTEASLADKAHPNDPAAALAAMKATAPRGLERASVLLDGKPADVMMDPSPTATQKVFDLEGAPIANAAARVKPIPPASTIVNPTALNDVKESIAGMKDGTLPPMMPGRATKEYLATMAEAHRQGYDLQAAVTDWNATQKHIATLNGSQQTRLNQSINALPELLDSVDALASKWKGGRFPILNKANLAAAKGGAYGDDVATVARQLDAQIADVTADLGSVYMGGNSPTDHALELAGKSLSGDWSEKVLHDMVTLTRSNVQIRQNSIRHTGIQGASADNPYAPKTAPAAAPTGLPNVGDTFQGGKVLKIEKVK